MEVHVSIGERENTSLVIVTKSHQTKIGIRGTTKGETEQEEELKGEDNLLIPTIPRKKQTMPSNSPLHPTL